MNQGLAAQQAKSPDLPPPQEADPGPEEQKLVGSYRTVVTPCPSWLGASSLHVRMLATQVLPLMEELTGAAVLCCRDNSGQRRRKEA